jgi:transcriptional regulator with XRE-family HTH domain
VKNREVPKGSLKEVVSLKMIGAAVAAKRRALGRSQSDLADQVQLNRTYLSDIERGEANVSFAVVGRLAAALGVSMSELIRNAEHLEREDSMDAAASQGL